MVLKQLLATSIYVLTLGYSEVIQKVAPFYVRGATLLQMSREVSQYQWQMISGYLQPSD
jgi:hypothetical protein